MDMAISHLRCDAGDVSELGLHVRKWRDHLWERWENLTGSGMNSHNHPMLGSVSSWFHKYLGGIKIRICRALSAL
jgi:hypothetical protein